VAIQLALFVANITQGIAHHVHNAKLNVCLWEDGIDGFREACQSINACDQYVLDVSGFKVV
jgi:hypothetical protein